MAALSSCGSLPAGALERRSSWRRRHFQHLEGRREERNFERLSNSVRVGLLVLQHSVWLPHWCRLGD